MPPQFTVDEYVTKVMMSNQPTLLVEGPSDERLFSFIFDSLKQANMINVKEVFIDTAAIISSTEIPSNREKVEAVTDKITALEFSSRFVGFADREFREFDTESSLSDRLGGHNRSGRLVWSRGHSIENYFFDYGLLRDPLRTLSDSSHFSIALGWMKERFQDVLKIACALSLAAKDIELLSMSRSIVDWNCFNSTSSSLTLDSDLWDKHLSSKSSLNRERIDTLIERFEHWLTVAKNSESEVIRWICHGHIGTSVIWNVFAKFINDATISEGAESREPRVAHTSHDSRFRQCASELARQVSSGSNTVESPLNCFSMLGIIS